jgi:hypothetical protein
VVEAFLAAVRLVALGLLADCLAAVCLVAGAFLAGAAFFVDAASVGVAAAAFFGMVALWVVPSSVATGLPFGG